MYGKEVSYFDFVLVSSHNLIINLFIQMRDLENIKIERYKYVVFES